MNNKEMVDYIESMVSELVGEDIRGAGVYENEEVTISLGGEQTQATTEEESLPVEPEGVPEEDFSNEKTSEAIYTTADKEHLDFLYGVFGSMDEARLKALASDLENAAIGNAKIELTTETDKDRFLACLDKLAMDEEAEASELSAIDDVLDEVFSTDIKQYIYLLPTNPNAIKRAFYGRFNDDLTDEDINSLCACVDEAIGDGVLNTDTVNIVREAFLNTEFVATLTDEQIELASQAIDDAVYNEEDLLDAFVRVIQAKLTDAVEDDSKILACRGEIRSVIEQVMALRSVSDIDADITNYLQSIEESDAHIETASTAFKTAAGPYITTDNVEDVLTALFDAISEFTDEETRDEISNIVKSSVFASTYSISRAKDDIKRSITEYTYANKIEAEEIETIKLAFKQAVGESLSLENLNVSIANFESIIAKVITAEQLNAAKATIREATIDTLYVNTLNAKLAVIEQAIIDTLDAKIANINVANIDFANIDLAQVEKIFSKAGVISDLTTETGSITGELVGVTISGDLIEANTLKADKLVVLGSDGLYYKLNVSGETVESQQTDYNSINGSNIQAKTITASKINVTDLVAFGATIAGLVLENGSIHSNGKTSPLPTETNPGLYFDSTGQFNTGDGTNFIASWYDTDAGKWKVKIQSDLITMTSGKNLANVVENVADHFWIDDSGAHVTKKIAEEYLEDPTNGGANTLITSDGMTVRDGTTDLAAFGLSGVTIGAAGGTQMVLDSDSMDIVSGDNNSLHIGYLNDVVTDTSQANIILPIEWNEEITVVVPHVPYDIEDIRCSIIATWSNHSSITTTVTFKNDETKEVSSGPGRWQLTMSNKQLTAKCLRFEDGFNAKMTVRYKTYEIEPVFEFAGGSATHRNAVALGSGSEASGIESRAFGLGCKATSDYSIAIGRHAIASGKGSFAAGYGNSETDGPRAIGRKSTAFMGGRAGGLGSFALGFTASASGESSVSIHGEASGGSSIALMSGIASGPRSIAHGYAVEATMGNAIATGYGTTAAAKYQHVWGTFNEIEDVQSYYFATEDTTVVQGKQYYTKTTDPYYHSGYKTVDLSDKPSSYNPSENNIYERSVPSHPTSSTKSGDHNSGDYGQYVFIIGNGCWDDTRSNALTVDWYGNINVDSRGGYSVGGTNILELVYPVGSIYMSVNATDPGTLFGGTWTRIEDTFLLASGSTYAADDGTHTTATGGEATVTLTADQTGVHQHTHSFTQPTVNGGAVTNGITGGAHSHYLNYFSKTVAKGTAYDRPAGTTSSGKANGYVTNSPSHNHNLPAHTHTVSGGAVGNTTAANATKAHNNMPPYLPVYMWKRTA